MTRAGLICLLSAVLLVYACQTEKLPKGVLSESEYAALLVEIYLAEARVNSQGLPRDSLSKFYFPFEEKLFHAKGLSDTAVRNTYQYYLNNPKKLQRVYGIVIDTLSLREQRYGGASQSR